ncbi:MAG: ABC transporter permease subunit [Granulosicoccus sp.]|nr:ABC transporter permease subunit [Granulosicoccus sp.]
MTTSTVAGRPASRNVISRLWNDKETRSVIVQIIAFALILGFFVFIIRNAVINLETLGKGFSFSFLSQPSSYDINQHLIEYDSRSSHFKAGVVGLINTLLIAIAGIILSTILGFILGVLRLSKNWLTNKLAHVYIEYVRNVPVLLHILLIHGLIIHALPIPKKALNFGEGMFLTNRGLYSPKPEIEPLFWLVIAAFVMGIVFTIWFKRYAKRVQDATGQIYPVFWISLGAILVVPLVLFFLLGQPVQWDVPALKGFNFRGGMVIRPEFIALWLALSFYTAAFIGEIVRAGITAVSYGQTEASAALGMPRAKTLRLVVIPQALRIIVPPLSSQYLNITKNSSLAIAIGYMDIVATIGGISLNQTGREMECMLIVLSLYLVLSLLISAAMNWYNDRIRLVER